MHNSPPPIYAILQKVRYTAFFFAVNITEQGINCKQKLSFSLFLHHTERKRSASYRNEMACRGVMK